MVAVSVKDVIRQEFDELCLEDKLSCPGLTKVLFNNKVVNSKKICRKRKLSCSSDHKVKRPRKPKRRKRGG
jgi:hypothetical protein